MSKAIKKNKVNFQVLDGGKFYKLDGSIEISDEVFKRHETYINSLIKKGLIELVSASVKIEPEKIADKVEPVKTYQKFEKRR